MLYIRSIVLGTAVITESVNKKAACTANGFAGLFGCVGSASAAYPIGYVIDHWDWVGYFTCMIICTFIILGIILANAFNIGQNSITKQR